MPFYISNNRNALVFMTAHDPQRVVAAEIVIGS